MKQHFPNMLCVLRMLLAPVMLWAAPRPPGFMALYFACGATDVADGFLARGWKVHSALGARLDTLADLVFWACCFGALIWQAGSIFHTAVVLAFVAVALLRGVNALLTRWRFGKWGMLHTWGNKAAGLALFVAVPVCVAVGYIASPVLWPVFVLSFAAAAEETACLLRMRVYNADCKGLFWN